MSKKSNRFREHLRDRFSMPKPNKTPQLDDLLAAVNAIFGDEIRRIISEGDPDWDIAHAADGTITLTNKGLAQNSASDPYVEYLSKSSEWREKHLRGLVPLWINVALGLDKLYPHLNWEKSIELVRPGSASASRTVWEYTLWGEEKSPIYREKWVDQTDNTSTFLSIYTTRAIGHNLTLAFWNSLTLSEQVKTAFFLLNQCKPNEENDTVTMNAISDLGGLDILELLISGRDIEIDVARFTSSDDPHILQIFEEIRETAARYSITIIGTYKKPS